MSKYIDYKIKVCIDVNMVKMKKAALGAFGMASLNALGVGLNYDGAEVPHQVSNFITKFYSIIRT